MSAPIDPAASLAAVGFTAGFLAFTGVHPQAVLWAAAGAGAMLAFSERTGKGGELASVLASVPVGAAGGTYAAHLVGAAGPVLVLASLVIGAGAKPLLSAAIAALERWVGRAGGAAAGGTGAGGGASGGFGAGGGASARGPVDHGGPGGQGGAQ